MPKQVTILDVANKSGYGVGTVSRVISGDPHVKASTRKKIEEVIKELNFTPNVNGARLRKKHSGVIAVMVPIINHPFFAEFVEDVDSVAMQNGYSLLLVTSKMNVEKERDILNKIKRKEVDGAIFVTHYEHDNEEIKGCPLVSVDRHLNNHVPFVSSDNYDSTKEAIEYLISTGAKRIGYLGTKPHVESEVMLREKAYLDVLEEHHLESFLMNEVVDHGEEDKLVEKFIETYKNVDAVFVSGTSLAQIFYSRMKMMGKKIPEEMQIISYDGLFNAWDNGEFISCIQQPIKELAEGAFQLLIDVINEKEVQRKNIYKSTFIKGSTTK